MSKILFISNISNRITTFVTASIVAAHSLNLDFYQAANWQDADQMQIEKDEKEYDIKIKSVPISRNPLSKTNLTAYKELVAFIKQEHIDYIHCNTPTGGVIGRLAGKKCKVKKVIYQAHGFHFYKGAPKKNWLVYYPVEKWLARYTDALITINSEDYEFAKTKLKLRNNGKVYYVPGVGIDTTSFAKFNKCVDLRNELTLDFNTPVLVSMGELNANKNNRVIIEALSKLENCKAHYILCGIGHLETELKKYSKELGVQERVHFLGYRKDAVDLCQQADVFVMPSFREGLSRSILEAMANGKPCIVSKIRGNVDLIDHGKGGYLCSPNDSEAFAKAIEKLIADESLRKQMGEYNKQKVKNFDLTVVNEKMKNVYKEVLNP